MSKEQIAGKKKYRTLAERDRNMTPEEREAAIKRARNKMASALLSLVFEGGALAINTLLSCWMLDECHNALLSENMQMAGVYFAIFVLVAITVWHIWRKISFTWFRVSCSHARIRSLTKGAVKCSQGTRR
jgi:hypothetical protein